MTFEFLYRMLYAPLQFLADGTEVYGVSGLVGMPYPPSVPSYMQTHDATRLGHPSSIGSARCKKLWSEP